MSLSYKKNKNANDLPARLRKATRPQPSQGCVPRGRSRFPSPSGASCEEVPSPEVALRATELYVRNSQGQSWQNSGHGAGGVRTSGSRSRAPATAARAPRLAIAVRKARPRSFSYVASQEPWEANVITTSSTVRHRPGGADDATPADRDRVRNPGSRRRTPRPARYFTPKCR